VCLPSVSRDASGSWKGINLTYYGLLTASAYVIAIEMLVYPYGCHQDSFERDIDHGSNSVTKLHSGIEAYGQE
jgi:hypothetical protein